jgi:hypothetical protein
MNSSRANQSPYNNSGRSWGFSFSGKIARYACSSLFGAEHFSLLAGTDSLADALLRRFGSLKALFRASFKELRQLLSRPKAEAVKRRFRWALSLRRNTLYWLSSPLPNQSTVVILAYSLSDAWRHHSCYAELRSEIGLGAAFQRVSGETQVQHHV